jgi:hypothetical protein
MRRRLALLGLALLVLGASMLASPSSADAGTVTKAAWWYKARTGNPATVVPPQAGPVPAPPATTPAPPTPGPPSVPEGSLLVEGTAAGADAIAAMTFSMAATESAPSLTITPSDTSAVPPDAVILACRAAVAWVAPDQRPGAWEDKPLVACDQSVQGIPADDGTITFALAPLCQQCAELDVILVPGTVPAPTDGTAPPVGSTFSLGFDAADGAVLTTSAGGGGDAAFTPDSSSFSPGTASSGSFSTPGPSFSAPSTPVAAPALEPQEQAPSVPQQAALPATVPIADDDTSTARGVAFLVLLAGLAFAGLAYLTPARDDAGTIGLGRFRRPAAAATHAAPLEPVEGGLGRFSRPRTGPPPALS